MRFFGKPRRAGGVLLCWQVLRWETSIYFRELLRRGYDVCVGKLDGYEIDFIATRQDEKIYVQVAKEINSESTREREYGRLLEICDNYPKYVLLDDDYAGGNYQGIKTIHIADFLLSSDF